MRITAASSPTSLRYLLVSGAVWSVLVVLCAAKHVENNPTALFSDPPPISENNSEDCNGILCIFEDVAQLQIARAKSQNENQEQGKRFAYVSVVNDVQVPGTLDCEEERKITSDQINWFHGHPPRQAHVQSLIQEQNSKSGDSQQPCEGQHYLECQHKDLYLQIREAEDFLLPKLKKAYALYARNTTWDNATSEVSVNDAALPPPVRHLKPAIEDAKRCGSFPVLEANRENKTGVNISEGSFEYNNAENFVCLMSSTYEIVTVLTWLLDMVQLGLAMGEDPEGSKSQVLDNLVEISTTLSKRLSLIRRKTLSEMKCRNRKPNNYVLVEILQCKLEDIGGPDHAVRGLQVIGLMDKCINILSQL